MARAGGFCLDAVVSSGEAACVAMRQIVSYPPKWWQKTHRDGMR
jgi:hypothetical protein